MRFAESNGLVIAAAAQVMALIVVGNRVIALVHLPGSESAGMRCPTAAVLHECTTLVRLYTAISWLATSLGLTAGTVFTRLSASSCASSSALKLLTPIAFVCPAAIASWSCSAQGLFQICMRK